MLVYSIPHQIPVTLSTELLPATPNATSGAIKSTSTMISWNQQQDADSYEISFQRATGNQQLGDCPAYQHSGSVPPVGATVTTHTLTGLQEFSTYFITVTAVNGAGRNDSLPVTVITLTTGMCSTDNTYKLTVLMYTFNSNMKGNVCRPHASLKQ